MLYYLSGKNMSYYYKNKVLKIKNFGEEIPINIIDEVEEIEIIDGIESIPARVFKKANNLKNVTLSKSVINIEEEAFMGAQSLEFINLENVKTIEACAFKGCQNLISVNLNNIEYLGNEVFAYAQSLSDIILSNKISYIPKACFQATNNLKDIYLPPNIKTLYDLAFSNSRIEKINLENVEILGANCFEKTMKLKNVNLVKIKKMGNMAFYKSAIESISLDLETIPIGCFEDCTRLKDVTLKNIKKIESSAFKNTAIENIKLPKTLESIGDMAFYNCDNLESINLYIKKINAKSFSKCSRLKKVVGTVEVIERDAFSFCSNLTAVEFGNLRVIEDNAFRDCSSLVNFDFSKIDYIGADAFCSCMNLSRNNVLDLSNVKTIKDEAFKGCINVKQVIWPNISLPTSIFENCFNIEKFNFPNGIKYIGPYAFYDCSKLNNVIIPKSVEKIYDNAFTNCTSLENITLPDNLEVLPRGIFKNCTNLKVVQLPQNLKVIKEEAFSNTGVSQLDFPESLEEIDNLAYSNCPNIQKLVIPNINKFSENAFYKCENLTSITMPLKFLNEDKNFISTNRFYNNCNIKEMVLFDESELYAINLEENEEIKNIYTIFLEDKNFYCFLTNSKVIIMSNNYEQIINYVDIKDYKYYNRVFGDDKFDNYLVFNYGNIISYLKYKIFANLNNIASSKVEILVALTLNINQVKQFYDNEKYWKYTKMKFKFIDFPNESAFLKLCYNLGLFVNDEKHKINVLNFINKVLSKDEILDATNFADKFDKLKISEEVNTNLLNFFKNNYKDFEEDNNFALLVYAINNFDELSKMLKDFNFQTLQDFAGSSTYKKVDKGNEKLARLVKLANYTQYEFENLQSIFNKSKSMPENVFDKIDKVNQEINLQEKRVVGKLLDIVDAEFKFEWLSKKSEYNVVLGDICKCCARYGSMGVGIMEAPMLDPRVQNLVVKDKCGDFVGKATVYVNPLSQYAVFNNFVVKDKYNKGEKGQQIYDAFMRGINAFVSEYDKNHPEKPLLDVTVGMKGNKMSEFIKQNLEKSSILLKGGKYRGYEGDGTSEQYILYKRTKERET